MPGTPVIPQLIVRYVRWLAQQRCTLLIASLLVAVAAAVLTAALPLRGEFSALLPADTPSVRALHVLEQRVPSFGTILVAAESRDAAVRERAVAALVAQLGRIDPALVASVDWDDREAREFAWDHRFLYAPLEDLRAARSQLDDAVRRVKLAANPLYVDLEAESSSLSSSSERSPLLGDGSLRRKLDEAAAARAAPSRFISRDGTMHIIVVRTTFDPSATDKANDLVGEVARAISTTAAEVGPGVTLGAQGDVYTALEEHASLLEGILSSSLLTIAVVALGLVLYFRSLRALVALFWALGVGSLSTFALTKLTIGSLNLATGFLSAIVVGNGINFGIVLLARYLEERRQRPAEFAMAIAIEGTVRGTLAAALAASVSYGSLVVTAFKGFREFGLIGGPGMILCWLAAYTVLPAALLVLDPRARASRPRLGRALARLVPQRPALIAVLGGLLVAIAGVIGARFVLGNPYEQDVRSMTSDSAGLRDARARLSRIDRAFGGDLSGGGFVIRRVLEEFQQMPATPLSVKARRVIEYAVNDG